MNAFRKSRVVVLNKLVLVGLLALVAIGIGAATAEAGGCHRGGGYSSSYSNYGPSYNYGNYSNYGNSCNYGSYNYGSYYPKTRSYPVTTFDCYGRPFTVWQTGYGSVPVSYLP